MWKIPPIIKIYEALGAVADDRLKVDGNTAKCFSSSGNKSYDIIYSPEENAIMTNDNGSYWKGYLGYPAIAFLLKKGLLPYKQELGLTLKGVHWKDVNQKFKNNFEETLSFILESLDVKTRADLEDYANELIAQIAEMKLEKLGNKIQPPSGY